MCVLICYDIGNVATFPFAHLHLKHDTFGGQRFSSQSTAAMSVYLLTLTLLTHSKLIATREANLAGPNFVVEWRYT